MSTSPLAKWVECSLTGPETGVQSLVESYQRLKKWYLIPPYLTLGIIRYISRVNWSNPRKKVVLSPPPQCSSNWKESLWIALNYGRPLYLIYIYIYIYSGQSKVLLQIHLPRLWRWRDVQDYEMPSLPDTHWVLLTRFACMAWSNS